MRSPEEGVTPEGKTIPAPETVGEPVHQSGEVSPVVVVLDYGAGNVRSAVRALEAAGARVLLTNNKQAALDADGLVVPGVGAFKAVVDGLKQAGAVALIERRLMGGRPVLGICVGLQVLFEYGVEHGERTEGLGQWPGVVERLEAPVVPHMGWNTVEPPQETVLFQGIENERFYFVHSYGVQDWDFPVGSEHMVPPAVTWAEHGSKFIAAVENGPLSATQFHPEKSGEVGLQLLRNWISTLPVTGRLDPLLTSLHGDDALPAPSAERAGEQTPQAHGEQATA
ncbi:imidazole glycerol phosphate synthase subunit HisH [Kocuria sp.]|uniref:imidazole glycerol phosphate synthase subunit HisH n=1 Tax=Kocuria sp. TaxID=1871328 RepID=UPI0026DEE1D2|nr:imidazole glycerol phosphate synthase subunit HisH [Kocuria sp.]MDO5618722.1 imidazole glycerol phosphate synthase subunit HisH [Kocuria sp.]